MKKRIFAAILAAAMMMSLVACGTETSVTESVETAIEATSASVEEATEEAVEEATEEVSATGVVEDGVYTNEFFGFKFEAAEGYTLAADETAEFSISDETQLKTVNVTVTNVGEVGSQEEIDAAIDLMLPELQSTYEGIGLTDVTIEKETITFAGAEYTGAVIKGSMDANGTTVDMVARQIYMVKDGYMACITATSFAEDATAELLAMGSALN